MPFKGERLRSRRIELGLTQDELADRLNTTQNRVWLFEAGKSEPSADMLVRLAKVLDVSTDYLLGLVDAPDETYPTALETPLSEFQHKCWQALRTDDLPTLLELIAQALRTQCLRSGD